MVRRAFLHCAANAIPPHWTEQGCQAEEAPGLDISKMVWQSGRPAALFRDAVGKLTSANDHKAAGTRPCAKKQVMKLHAKRWTV